MVKRLGKADLAGSEEIHHHHLAEALKYHPKIMTA
jgi:predicted ATPase with chaperone activity